MNRSTVARLILVFGVIAALGAGAAFFGMKLIRGGADKALFLTAGGQTMEQKAGSSALKVPNLTSTEVFRGITAKKQDGVILSPVMFSKANGGYQVTGDLPFGMTSNIRHETIVMKKEAMEASRKGPSRFDARAGANLKISLPEMPQVMEGNIYYSHTNGIIPLDVVIMWPQPAVRDTAKWNSAFTAAGFKEISSEEVFNDGKKVKTVRTMCGPDTSVRSEILVERDIAKKTELVGYSALYMTSPADGVIRKFLDDTNAGLMKVIASKPFDTGLFKWRQPLGIPEYRKAGSSAMFNVTTVNFSDRYFPGTSEPLIQSSCELWNSVPIGYSWVMRKSSWDKIRSEAAKTLIGKDADEKELAAGTVSSDSIFLKATAAAESGPGAGIIRIDAIDKRTDDKIAVIFDNFAMVNVNGLRDGVK